MYRMRNGNLILKNRPQSPSVQEDGTLQFVVPSNALRMNLSGGQIFNYWDCIVRGDRIYNKTYHTTDVREWKNLKAEPTSLF